MEFTKPAYNIWEHNHLEQSTEQMNVRLEVLASIDQEWQCKERRQQIQQEMALLSFELSCRYAEQKNIDIETAWAEHEYERI